MTVRQREEVASHSPSWKTPETQVKITASVLSLCLIVGLCLDVETVHTTLHFHIGLLKED